MDGERKGPEALREILSRLFVSRGWGRKQGRMRLEQAWAETVDPKHAKLTRVVRLRRGVLEVEVANSAVLQELASFHKRKLLERLRQSLPEKTVTDLRFRAGSWDIDK